MGELSRTSRTMNALNFMTPSYQSNAGVPFSVGPISIRAKIVLGILMCWCVVQVVFLIQAFLGGPPSASAELVSAHNDLQYRAAVGFHIFGFITLGSVWIMPMYMRNYLKSLTVIFVSVIAFTLATVFFTSIYQANYQVYLDINEEQFVRRDIHLLPPGVKLKVISFKDFQNVPRSSENALVVALTEMNELDKADDEYRAMNKNLMDYYQEILY